MANDMPQKLEVVLHKWILTAFADDLEPELPEKLRRDFRIAIKELAPKTPARDEDNARREDRQV